MSVRVGSGVAVGAVVAVGALVAGGDVGEGNAVGVRVTETVVVTTEAGARATTVADGDALLPLSALDVVASGGPPPTPNAVGGKAGLVCTAANVGPGAVVGLGACVAAGNGAAAGKGGCGDAACFDCDSADLGASAASVGAANCSAAGARINAGADAPLKFVMKSVATSANNNNVATTVAKRNVPKLKPNVARRAGAGARITNARGNAGAGACLTSASDQRKDIRLIRQPAHLFKCCSIWARSPALS